MHKTICDILHLRIDQSESRLVQILSLSVALVFTTGTLLCAEAELEVADGEMPRIPPVEVAKALDTFEVNPNFDLSLAAHEPDVMDPIQMAFDEKGRAYVIEMRGYSEHREEAMDRIRILYDDDHDGIFDRSVIFKENLKWPSAIVCYKGGVFVGATPDIYYFRDNDGDGVCDEERTVFTGFGGSGDVRLNMQALFNSLQWGPDNRIWGASAPNAGNVVKAGASVDPLSLRGSDFSFDPETLDLRLESGTAQYGMSFDSMARRFVCSNSRHLIWVAYERSQIKTNPWFSLPAPLLDVAEDGPTPDVYRISPDEPWRIVRTRWRVGGVVQGIVEGGGRVSGFLVAATGIHMYWGTAFPKEYYDGAFVGDVGSNLVHYKKMITRPGSVQPVGVRPDPNEKTEFLRSRDTWFRPTSFATGPDGTLYITDMYRETIEHPWSLPEPIKKHLDLDAGNDRGRIYRIAPKGFKPAPFVDLGTLSDAELTAMQMHPNEWHRMTARRLLYERGKAVPPIPPHQPFPAVLASEVPLLDQIPGSLGDRWMEAAVLNSLRTPKDLAAAWEATKTASNAFRAELAGMIGRANDAALLASIGDQLAAAEPTPDTATLLTALRDGMIREKGDWKKYFSETRWQPLIERAIGVLENASAPTEARIASVKLLSQLPAAGMQERFQAALAGASKDADLTLALVGAINDLDSLIARFATLPATARDNLAVRILAKPAASTALLEAIRDKKLALSDIPASLIENLRRHANGGVQKLATDVLPPVVKRSDVVASYQPALSKKGDPAKGKMVFQKVCFTCHKAPDGEGIQLGPPVASFVAGGAETILGNILDPNREVAPQYQAYTFELKDGSVLTGIIVSENAADVSLRMPGGIDRTFARADIRSMKGLGQSLMPEGLEAAVSIDDMADLLSFLTAPVATK